MSAHLLQITPPESFTSSPPTPPATEEKSVPAISHVLAEVRQHKDGHYPAPGEHWHKFPLNGHQYDGLQRQLRKEGLWDHYKHKIRYDYFPLANLYVLRMPGSLHESFVFLIAQDILRQLHTIGQGSSPSAIFAGDIENSASAEISFKETGYGSHQPDIAFQHFEAQYPGVIVELSYSQKKGDLSRLAHEYILGSDADIRVMIGIDVEYKGSKKASISIWRPHIEVDDAGERELCVVQTVTDQLFRDDVGNLVPDSQASLQLRLEDFGTEAFAVNFPGLTGDVHISAEQLFAYLERAEAKAKRVKDGEGLVRSTKPWVRKRRRDSTPPEQLDPDREGRFAEQEQRALKKAMRDDVSYKASSSDADHE
ncbi:hypothetical protein BJ875DRAFT_488739 [Amylocarpus encephaloides]|uniref:Uncharacterized protein n=1 Tax=Amylocarpus encephaloides TaxID=45428 RepID=A0A9P7Y946_9HELO|nr:hypothetical protein BJ875DRAFT_488739 [Amylocarpus encephaloides]